jgi:hypothetical protein
VLSTIIPYLEAKVDAGGVFDKIYGLGELVVEENRTSPNLYLSSGQYEKLTDFDHQASFCYFRLTGAYNEANSEDDAIGGVTQRVRTYPLKLVGYCGKDVFNTDDNYIDEKVASNVSLLISETEAETLSASLKADFVEISATSTELRRKTVLDEEVSGDTSFINIPFDKVFFQIEFDVTVTGNIDCFDVYDCNDDTTDVITLIRDKYCEDVECTGGVVTIVNTDDAELYSVSVASGGTAEQVIPAQSVSINGMSDTISFPANTTGLVTGVHPIVTGQTTSIEPGDDGDLQFGRGDTWTTLDEPNEYGTLDRFVSLTANVIHDCLTNLLWYNNIIGAKSLADYISDAAALTVDGYSNWYVPNEKVINTILKFTANPLNYAPINYDATSSGLMYLVTSNQDPRNNGIASFLIQGGLYAVAQTRGRIGTSGADSLKRCLYYRPKNAA